MATTGMREVIVDHRRRSVPIEPVSHAFVTALPNGYRFTLPTAPRTKKNSGTIQNRGKKRVIRPSESWLHWRNEVMKYVGTKPEFRLRIDRPVNVCALFYRDRDAGDASGYYNGLGDVLEEIGVVTNDRLLVSWDGSRLRKDAANPRTEVTLTWEVEP